MQTHQLFISIFVIGFIVALLLGNNLTGLILGLLALIISFVNGVDPLELNQDDEE